MGRVIGGLPTALCLAGLVILVGCGPSEAERRKVFMVSCYDAFTKAQCGVLWEVKKSSDEANSAAMFAAGMAGAGVGMSAARAGR